MKIENGYARLEHIADSFRAHLVHGSYYRSQQVVHLVRLLVSFLKASCRHLAFLADSFLHIFQVADDDLEVFA